MTDIDRPTPRCCTTPARRSTRSPTPRRAWSRTGPRSARPARRRCSTPTGRARSWTCPASRSCPPGSTTGSRSGSAASSSRRSSSRGCSTSCGCTSARRSTRCARSRGSRSRARCSTEGNDLGIPARVFPQWLRCTGCDYLGPLPRFTYTNTHPFRPDLAQFTPQELPRPRRQAGEAKRESPAVPAQHLLTCTNGHLDEFPYTLWVHRGGTCPKAELPDLKMRDANVGKSVGSTIVCAVVRRDPRHGRGPRRGRARQAAAEVPRPPPAPQRVRRRRATPARR